MSVRRTLCRAVTVDGVGLHDGLPSRLVLEPAPFGTGLVFVMAAGEVPATLPHATAEPGCTVLTCGNAMVRTPEHLLAALDALGVTDARLRMSSVEVPAGDGSAATFVAAIDAAGRIDGPALTTVPFGPATVTDHGGEATSRDGDGFSVDVDFGERGPKGALSVPRTEAAFRTQIAFARTFVLRDEISTLQAAGRGRGANADNTLVWPDGLRRVDDEPVRHKLLDLWGDAALCGPRTGHLHVARGSHRLHLALLRRCSQGPAWGIVPDLEPR